MIIGDHREVVVANIAQAVANQQFNAKVEPGDPTLTAAQRQELVTSFLNQQGRFDRRLENLTARTMMATMTAAVTRTTTVSGMEKLALLPANQGVVVTANHFNPLDSLVVRHLALKAHQRLFIVVQDTNLAMGGLIGFLMRHLDVLPLSPGIDYLGKTFPRLVESTLAAGHWLLIYPEEEMWFNYRKPRPPKRGAYHYAAKNLAPILPCFIEIRPGKRREKADPNFFETSYHLHLLDPIFPDPTKPARENAQQMMATDFAQRKAAYERIYHRPYAAPFALADIAGWAPQN
mgnify:CR=1 FL=1